MPVVLSYNDVNALGSLAYQTGGLYGRARRADQDAVLLAQIDAQRNQAASNLQEISARERQADLDRQLRADLAAGEQQYRYGTLAAGERELQARMSAALAEASMRSQAGIQEQALKADLEAQRDKRLHEMTMQRIEREAQMGRFDRRNPQPATLGPGGMPSKEFAQQEVQEFGHLVPFRAGESVSAESAARARDRAMETANSLSSLPTNQIEAYVQQHPNDPWTPYMRAIVQARRAVSSPGAAGGPVGAMPEGSRPPGPRNQSSTRLGSGRGLGDPILGRLSDEDIQKLAQDPAALQRLLGR